jgi:predicted nucleotidyltransferase component of viral defense system
LRDRPTLQDLVEVQAYFKLPSTALVEKDWFAVRALAAIAAAPCAPFQLIFGGGTALGRAHRLIKRMSEDIDLKIIGVDAPTRKALRELRETISGVLLAAGFKFDPKDKAHRDSRNESRYTIYNLPYAPLAKGEGALRPALKIEVAVWPLRQQSIHLPVSSFIAEAFKKEAELPAIACVSVTQTAAEKFVALTRRAMAEAEATVEKRDKTLVRHIYDLHVIQPHYDLAEVAVLAAAIMPHDAEVFGHKHKAYRADPLKQTHLAIEVLERDPYYRNTYLEFARDMIYGEVPGYETCLHTLRSIAGLLPG